MLEPGLAYLFLACSASIFLYFLPFYIAMQRNLKNQTAIALTNLFFGWTGVGWVVALLWAVSDNAEPQRSSPRSSREPSSSQRSDEVGHWQRNANSYVVKK